MKKKLDNMEILMLVGLILWVIGCILWIVSQSMLISMLSEVV